MESKEVMGVPVIMITKNVMCKSIVATLLVLAVGMAHGMQLQAMQQQSNPKMLTNNNIPKGYLSNEFQAAALQKVLSVDLQNVTLEQGLKTIARKAGLKLVYSKNIIPAHKQVSLQKSAKTLENALWTLLAGTYLRFGISSNNHLVIMKLPKEDKKTVQQVQAETVSGTVSDGQTGETLPGVNIAVKGTTTGTSTDANGQYELDVESLQDTLVFTFIGYNAQEVAILGRTTINVALSITVSDLEEMVVTGYRKVKASELTSSISRVSAEKLQDAPRENAIQTLQGNAAGVRVSKGNGQPGSPLNVHIRGKGSINASSSPLYVVDGVPIETSSGISYGVYGGYTTSGIAGINSDDIASIDVLKDAQATSIYGSRGANGVVIITTKEGEGGKPKIHFSTQSGINKMSLLNRTQPLNTSEMLELLREGWANAGKDPNNFASELEKQGIDENQNTDWVDALTRTGSFSKYYLSISGGSEGTQYFASIGYHDDKSALKYLHYKRGTARVSVTTQPLKRLSLNASISSNLQETLNAQRVSNWLASPVRALYRMQPWLTIYNEDGSYNFGYNVTYNPVAVIKETHHKGTTNNLKGNIGAKLDIVKGIAFETKTNLALTYGNTDMFFPGNFGWGRNSNGRGYARSNRNKVWSTSNILRYKGAFHSRHNLEALIGYEAQNYLRTGSYAYATDFIPNLRTLGAASSPITASSSETEHSIVGTFLNANYNYNSSYYLSASIRRDGSSRFGADRQYANFWSVGAGWDIDNTFLQKISSVSALKLRSSYGISGNQGIGNYESTGRYGSGYVYADHAGYAFTQYENPSLTWEQNKSFNVGLDFGLFQNRLRGTVEFYNRNTSQLLFDRPLPATSGLSSYAVNFGSMKNSGLEVSLSSNNIISDRNKGFSWNTDFNISTLKNEITKIPETIITDHYIHEIGSNYYTWYLPAYAGVDPKTGEKQYYSSKDKSQTTTDYEEAVRLKYGNSMPKYYGGLTNKFSFKNFSFSFLFYYSWGNQLYNASGSVSNSDGSEGFNTAGKLSRYTYEHRWQKPGDKTDVPKIVLNGPDSHRSSRWLADGSFIRLRDITLSYSFPSEMLNAIKLQRASVYVRANNLFTYIKDDRLRHDPEQSISGQQALRTPKNKTIVLGINIDI